MRLVFLLLVGTTAFAADGTSLLARGVQQYREAAYAASAATLEQARAATLSRDESAECAFYLAADYVALSSPAAARREIKTLLQAAPGYELPRFTSPKIQALFREVKDELERAPRLKALPPRQSPGSLELRFEASRTDGTAYGAAWVRWRGEPDWREVPLAHRGDQLIGALPVVRGGALELWAEAQSPRGAVRAGSPAVPLEVAVTAPPVGQKQPLWRRWWVWTAVAGALVVGAGLGVGLGLGLPPKAPTSTDAVLRFGGP
jgi:hypothetical protein